MNRMKITFGIMSNKYQIEAYNKLDAYAAMAIFFKRDLPYVLLFEPHEIIKDNFIERINKEFLIKENNSPWISISEQQPEHDELVLTRLEAYHFKPKLNVYNAYDKAWDTEDGDDFDCNISDNDLWMSIPTFDDIMNSNKYIIKRLK